MYSIFYAISEVLRIYSFLVFVWFVLGLLIQFRVVNRSNQVVSFIDDFLNRIIEPLLKPIRRRLPPVNGLDLSPMVLILLLWLARLLIGEFVFGMRYY